MIKILLSRKLNIQINKMTRSSYAQSMKSEDYSQAHQVHTTAPLRRLGDGGAVAGERVYQAARLA